MRLTILGCGTSTGVPIPGCTCAVCTSKEPRNQRLRTSALVTLDSGHNILIDTSPDLRAQSLRFGISRIDAVVFTHAHADHILGMEDLRAFNFIQKQAIPCYATSQTAAEIRAIFRYIFSPDPDYEGGQLPLVEMHEFDPAHPLQLFDYAIFPFTLEHGKKPVCGFKFGNLAYATDCNGIPKGSRQLISGLKHLILDGLRFDPHRTHFTIPQAIDMAKNLNIHRTYLIHLSHTVDYLDVSKRLPPDIVLCYDGMQITF